jgi:hypothetical protein
MIKTLQITSVILAALAIFVLSIPFVFTTKSDPKIKELLSADLSDQSKNAAQNTKNPTGNQEFPLVLQAQAFAKYLKPAPTIVPPTRPASNTTTKIDTPVAPVTPKFTLLGTSYNGNNPELSQAFISEPGSNPRWVKQSAKVGHLIIEKVQDGMIIVNNGQTTFELKKEQTPSIVVPVKSPAKAGVTVTDKQDIPVQPALLPSQSKTETGSSASPGNPLQITSSDPTGNTALDLILKQIQQATIAGDKAKVQQLETIYARMKSTLAAQLNKQETEIIANLGKNNENNPVEPNGSEEK